MHVGLTGSRDGITTKQKQTLIMHLAGNPGTFEELTFHHGGCIGADEALHTLFFWLGSKIEIRPGPIKAKTMTLEPYAGHPRVKILPVAEFLSRNRDIVADTSALLAFPKETHEVNRSGTWATIRYAKEAQMPVTIFHPLGAMTLIFPDGSEVTT
jgi:hypothetical protein